MVSLAIWVCNCLVLTHIYRHVYVVSKLLKSGRFQVSSRGPWSLSPMEKSSWFSKLSVLWLVSRIWSSLSRFHVEKWLVRMTDGKSARARLGRASWNYLIIQAPYVVDALCQNLTLFNKNLHYHQCFWPVWFPQSGCAGEGTTHLEIQGHDTHHSAFSLYFISTNKRSSETTSLSLAVSEFIDQNQQYKHLTSLYLCTITTQNSGAGCTVTKLPSPSAQVRQFASYRTFNPKSKLSISVSRYKANHACFHLKAQLNVLLKF